MSNKFSKMHYDVLAPMLGRSIGKAIAQFPESTIVDSEGERHGIGTLFATFAAHLDTELKADNPRYVSNMFLKEMVKHLTNAVDKAKR